jgi:hypothetical protein
VTSLLTLSDYSSYTICIANGEEWNLFHTDCSEAEGFESTGNDVPAPPASRTTVSVLRSDDEGNTLFVSFGPGIGSNCF